MTVPGLPGTLILPAIGLPGQNLCPLANPVKKLDPVGVERQRIVLGQLTPMGVEPGTTINMGPQQF